MRRELPQAAGERLEARAGCELFFGRLRRRQIVGEVVRELESLVAPAADLEKVNAVAGVFAEWKLCAEK